MVARNLDRGVLRSYYFLMNRTAAIVLFCVNALPVLCQNTASLHERAAIIWSPQPLLKFDDFYPTPTVKKEMIASLKVADVTIELEQDTKLEAMQQRFGGTIGAQGDASESLLWLCLHGSDKAGPWVLWLESGEIDGPYVGGFEWLRVPRSAQFDQRCAALPDTNRVELPVNLRLGAAVAKVLQTLGQPTYRKGHVLVYEHEHNETIRGEPFISDNSVIVGTRDGVVRAIAVNKTTSN
jgi:hypothetical protein